MTVIWMSTRKNKKNEFETETLRTKDMSYLAALKEILRALEKLKYKKMQNREWSISLSKSDSNQEKDLFSMTIVGLPEEIAAILADDRVKKYMT